MNQTPLVEVVTVETLMDRVGILRKQGWRLVQICGTRLADTVELTYSFDLRGKLENVRVQLPADNPRVPSIAEIFAPAFLYENELHDLFNVQIENLAIDFKGHLFVTSVKYPFSAAPPAPPAKGAPKAPAKSPAPPAPPAVPSPASATPPPATQTSSGTASPPPANQ